MSQQNARGPIAETYHALQGLDDLERAKSQVLLPLAGEASRVRCLLQTAEVALLNLANLLDRVRADVAAGATGSAALKLGWALGFHRVLSWVGQAIHRRPCPPSVDAHLVHPSSSPAHADFFRAYLELDAELVRVYPDAVTVGAMLAGRTLDHPESRLFQLTLLCNLEAASWERRLDAVPIPIRVEHYASLIGSDWIRSAVYDIHLQGDTFITQFRGLHQIPEILAAEATKLVEESVRYILSGRLPEALDAILGAASLFEGSLPCLVAMVDNLCPADYHQIRENLGQTSGSHSVALHHHLFHDLYEQLGDAITAQVRATPSGDVGAGIRGLGEHRHDSPATSLAYRVVIASLELRCHIRSWRELHLNLPRNNLGGEGTRSLIGSVDAVSAVRRLRDAAASTDPLAEVAGAFGLLAASDFCGPVGKHLDRESSWDSFLQRALGAVTQSRFPQVQERTGVFTGRCPYASPAPKKVD